MEYTQVLRELFARQAHRGMKLGLDRVRALLDRLGAPDRVYRSILIAGTNGKGSTAAFSASLLRAGGVRTGLYTSPHLCRFTERIQVDGVEVDRARVVELYARALHAANVEGVEPTFFELTTAMALLHFAEARVDVAVLEVGLGGRLDATNATEPVVSGITPVDLDHMALLGPTVQHIAKEKAGVMRAGRPAWIAPQSDEARAVLMEEGRRLGAQLHEVDPRAVPTGALGLAGVHQRLNALLATRLVRAADVVLTREQEARGLASARWPARLEWLTQRSGVKVLLDGAHNPHGARSLALALQDEGPIRHAYPLIWLLATTGDRDAGALATAVTRHGGRRPDLVVTTQARAPTAVPATVVARQLRQAGFESVEAVPSVPAAVDHACARAGKAGAVLAFGSLYAAGEVRAALTGEPIDAVALTG